MHFLLIKNTINNQVGNFNLYKHRTLVISEQINNTWVQLQHHKWKYYGVPTYNLCGIKDEELIRYIILQSPNKNEFFFVDVGAGDYHWVNNVVNFLKNDPLIPRYKTYHIIGLNGENNLQDSNDKVLSENNIKIYKLSNFNIENMMQVFLEKNIKLNGKVDLMVSKRTLRHLVDPVGTFFQMYQLMKIGGFLLLDGLPFTRIDNKKTVIYDSNKVIDQDLNIEHLLKEDVGNNSYLMCPAIYSTKARPVMIKKISINATKKSLRYIKNIQNFNNLSKTAAARFILDIYTSNKKNTINGNTAKKCGREGCYYGSRDLYNIIARINKPLWKKFRKKNLFVTNYSELSSCVKCK